jgi:hypothetical protein
MVILQLVFKFISVFNREVDLREFNKKLDIDGNKIVSIPNFDERIGGGPPALRLRQRNHPNGRPDTAKCKKGDFFAIRAPG